MVRKQRTLRGYTNAVDDFLYIGTTSFIDNVINPLCAKFEICNNSRVLIFLFRVQNSERIYLDQI